MQKLKLLLSKAKEQLDRYKKGIIAAIVVVVLIVLIGLGFSVGTKNPIKPLDPEAEKGGVLQVSFDRWYRGEKGELLATFFMQNHSEEVVNKINIICVAYSADNKEVNRFEKSVKLNILAGEERLLNKTYIGNLDPITQKVICQITSWE